MSSTSNTPNPKAVSTAETSKPSPSLKYLAYGVYLQLFLGVGLLAIGGIGVKMGTLFDGPTASGCILIGLGINSLIYIQRYKRTLR